MSPRRHAFLAALLLGLGVIGDQALGRRAVNLLKPHRLHNLQASTGHETAFLNRRTQQWTQPAVPSAIRP
ncbi:hypothetical protein CUJ87_26360 [Paraburkholderia caledonica]|nr:hypothetical protein CUJ87_26360 [Paraburkholderia caledonica]